MLPGCCQADLVTMRFRGLGLWGRVCVRGGKGHMLPGCCQAHASPVMYHLRQAPGGVPGTGQAASRR
jgi:hypothetical protein